MLALRIASIKRAACNPTYYDSHRDWDTRHNNRNHSGRPVQNKWRQQERFEGHNKETYVYDWREKCLNQMDAEQSTCFDDHEEVQPQDVEQAPKEDPAQQFEEIYNQIAAERKEKKAAAREERRKLREEAMNAKTCAIF